MSDKPVVAQKAPYAVEVEAGKTYYWCSCGRSKNQPFCDGSHAETSFTPQAWTAQNTGTQWFCGCKASKAAPMCDGSHKNL
ncbi:MAG: CDGSH iron-sulfur domain-containing protein [Methylobacillus sp.]|jgi:CDGSH-type Zn-finger protein|nr:CDGSH iron-sulfur domain-containing protein [Methylobacillus sp.]